MENDYRDYKKSIVFGITKLDLGGAERVLVDMCNRLCLFYNITIFTIYSRGALEKELDKSIKIISIYKKQNKIIPIYLLLFGKNVYNKYIKGKFDIEIAFLEGPVTRLFRFKDDKGKIAWIHNDINLVFGKGLKAKLKKQIDRNIYKKYDLLVFVSKDNQKSFNKIYGNRFNEKVIYNYIDKKRILKKSEEKIEDRIYEKFIEKRKENENIDKNDIVILSVCRLTYQKGLDRLIRIHKRLIDEGIYHKIFVIGKGEERKKLEELIEKYNISNSFFLLGAKQNPYPYIKTCDIFLLVSYYEGYGMVVEEAKILGKKILITDTAAKEAVKNYSNAVITKNDEEDIYRRLKNEIINFNSNI